MNLNKRNTHTAPLTKPRNPKIILGPATRELKNPKKSTCICEPE